MKDVLDFLSSLTVGGAIAVLTGLFIIVTGAVEIVRAFRRKT